MQKEMIILDIYPFILPGKLYNDELCDVRIHARRWVQWEYFENLQQVNLNLYLAKDSWKTSE